MTAPSTPKDPKHTGIGRSIVDGVEQAVSTVANAASVAATGSELGVLELAVEDDLGLRKVKKKPVRKKTTAKRVQDGEEGQDGGEEDREETGDQAPQGGGETQARPQGRQGEARRRRGR